MNKIKILKAISFDGERRQAGQVIEITKERLAEMIENFKSQNLKVNLYIEILEEATQEPKKKRTRNKK